jgi:hypothetical protein
VARCPPLERHGGSPEGYRGMVVWWANEAFWDVGFICLWAAAGAGRDFAVACLIIIFRKG